MTNTNTDISSLLSIITSAASNIESYYKTSTKPSVPSLDDTESHPLDSEVYPLEVKHSLQMLEGACAQLCSTLARPNHTMLNRYLRIFEPACLGVALRARIADILLDQPSGMNVSEISKRCGVESKKLSRVLRTLCSNHIFREVTDNVFVNNRLSMQLVSSEALWHLGVHTVDEPNGKASLYLADTLLDPEWGSSYLPERSPFNRFSGLPYPLYVHFGSKDDPKGAEQGARFAKGMVGWNEAADAGALVTGFPWDQLPSGAVVNDLGGGWGHIAMQLYKKYPNLMLKLQDLPERTQQAQNDTWPRECPEAIADGRIEFKQVDLFIETPIPNCDIYLLKNVIHNMTPELATKVLSNTRKAMAPNSRILINEYMIQGVARASDDEAKFKQAPLPLLPNFGAGRIRPHYLDMAMLTQLNSEERSLEDYLKLGESAGLHFVKLWDLGETHMIELAVV